MSLNEILYTGTSGLSASQAGMRSISNNIANVGVSGYARERTTISTAVSGGKVTGVMVGEPERVADSFLENAVYRRGGNVGQSEAVANYLDRLQALLGAPGSEGGLAGRIDALSATAAQMSGLQGSPQTTAQFTGSVQDAIDTMKQLGGDIANLRGEVETELGYTVDRINVLLGQVHDLNEQIAQSGGHATNGVENRRVAALDELSSLMKVNIREQSDGRVTIETGSGQVLLDKRLRELSYPSSRPGTSQPIYPPIDIRFVDPSGKPGAATGDRIDSSAIGGKLGGLIDTRDNTLPRFSEQIGVLFSGTAEALNAVSNEGTTLPPPTVMTGRETGLVATDRLGFTGSAVFAVVGTDGTLVNKTTVDFDALGPTATVQDAVDAINAGLAPDATATLVDGVLSITATSSVNGVAIAQDEADPSDRAGVGFSQFFGMNDIVRSDRSALMPSGFDATDPHGFGPGESADFTVRDSSGRVLASYTLTGSGGPTYGDLVTELNSSPLGAFGSFSMDDRGRFRFEPAPSSTGATISIPSDSTNRLGTGRTFSSISGLSGDSSGLRDANVRADILANPARLPLARLQLDVAVGEKAIGSGDVRGANAFVEKLGSAIDLGKDGSATIDAFSSQLLGKTGAQTAQARAAYEDASARRDDAVVRRDNYAGVNIDEELAQMVVLQNSYSASARVITTASDMYDTLLGMIN